MPAVRGNSQKGTPKTRRDFIVPMRLEMKHYVRSVLLGSIICLAEQTGFAADGHWVTTWGCGPQLTEPGNLRLSPLACSTLRPVGHVTRGGKRLRRRFANG